MINRAALENPDLDIDFFNDATDTIAWLREVVFANQADSVKAKIAGLRLQARFDAWTTQRALDRYEKENQSLRAQLEWLWANTHIVFWPPSKTLPDGRFTMPYPIEHTMRAGKNSRGFIQKFMTEDLEKKANGTHS